MPIRIHTITALVLAGAAIAASPALAASMTPGNKGPADLATDRGAPLTLPAITPMPTPQVSRDVTRGIFDLDFATALDALTTVTYSADGTVTETPASEGVRAALEEMMKGNTGG